MSNEVVVPEIDERSRRTVISLLGTRPLRQVAEEAGVSMEMALQIKQDIGNSMDALTVEEHVAKAFVQLQEVVNFAMQEFQSTDDARSKAPLLSAAVTATKTTLQMLEKWETKNKGSVDVLNSKRQSELKMLMVKTVDSGVDEIAELYDLPKQDLFDIFNAKLMEAAADMVMRNADPE